MLRGRQIHPLSEATFLICNCHYRLFRDIRVLIGGLSARDIYIWRVARMRVKRLNC